MADCYAYLDANAVLHFKTPDQIPWSEVLGCESPTVVVSMSLLAELDLKTYDGTPGVKARARDRRDWVKNRIKSGDDRLRGGKLFVATATHGLDLEAIGFNRRSRDADMIAEVLAGRKKEPNARHVLVTSDAVLTALGKAQGIEVVELPPGMDQPVEEEVERELRRVKQKLHTLESRAPELSVMFKDESSVLRVTLPEVEPLTEDEIRQRISRARSEHRPAEIPDVGISGVGASARFIGLPTVEQLRAYNEALSRYFSDLESYLRVGRLDEQVPVALPIRVMNNGKAPAERVIVDLRFPAAFFVTTMPLGHSYEPRPPTMPSPATEALLRQIGPTPALPDPFGPRDPQFEFSQNGTHVMYRNLGTIDHGWYGDLELHTSFELRSKARPFRIDWEVRSASLPESVLGSLSVVCPATETEQGPH